MMIPTTDGLNGRDVVRKQHTHNCAKLQKKPCLDQSILLGGSPGTAYDLQMVMSTLSPPWSCLKLIFIVVAVAVDDVFVNNECCSCPCHL